MSQQRCFRTAEARRNLRALQETDLIDFTNKETLADVTMEATGQSITDHRLNIFSDINYSHNGDVRYNHHFDLLGHVSVKIFTYIYSN